jgi:hypothetical protein
MDFTPFWHLRYLEKTLCIGTSTVRSLDNFNKLLAIPDTNSIRRKMDISYVLLSFAYQIQISKNAEYANYYWVIMSVVIFFFPLGHFLNNHNAWLGTFCQGLIHVGGNMGNILLYSSYISPHN